MTLHSEQEKRIRKNPKYQHVKTKLDTGSSLSKYMEKLEERRTYFKYSNDEIFKRLEETTFAQMILQAHSSGANLEHQFSPQDVGDTRKIGKIGPSATSTQLSVLSCGGEVSLENEDLADRPCPNWPYLLLDVREQDDYDRCHIIGAHNFPIVMLSRFRGIKEIWEYKNIPGKIIVLYDEDETIASRVATIMCQRGFENVYMLSGGLKAISKTFPEGMTTDSTPISQYLSSSTTSCMSSSTSKKNYLQQLQQRQQEPTQAEEKRWWFTSDELCKIQQQLDEISSQSGANSAGSQQSSGLQSSRPLKLSSRISTTNSQSGSGPSRTQSQQISKMSTNLPLNLSNLMSTTHSQSGPPSVESQQTFKFQRKRPLKTSSHVSTTLSKSAAPSAKSQQTSKVKPRWK